MAFADTAKLAVNLSLEGNFSSQIGRAESSLSSFNASVGKTVSKVGNDLGQGIRRTGQNLERLAFVAGGLAIGAGAAVTKWAGDFQAQLNTINTIAFATPEALGAIGDEIKAVSSKTGIALDDLTTSYYDLLSAGVKTADAQSLLNDAVTLGIGGLATTAQTVDLLTTAYNAYHLTAQQSATATDQFAQAVADGKVRADQIAASFADVASIASTYRVGIDQIATSYAFLTAQGVQATEVTTEMQRAIISLIKPLPALAAAQKALKINFTEEIQKKGLVPALEELRIYADKNKIPLIELLGRVEAVKFALQTTGPNYQGYLAEQQRILDSGGEAAKQAAERQQGFNYQLSVLKANVKIAGIAIGDSLLPPLAELSKELSDFIVGHAADIKRFGVDLGNGLREAVKWAKSLDWNSIGDGLKAAAFWGKTLIEGFMNLPPQVKETLAGLYALNKLSGGAVVNIGVDITKGLAGTFLSRGSSPANPLYVSGVGVGGVGGGGLGIVGALGIAGLVLGAAEIAGPIVRQWAIDNGLSNGMSQAQQAHQGTPSGSRTVGRGSLRSDASGGYTGTNAFSLEARDAAFAANAGNVFGSHSSDFALQQFRSGAAGAISLLGARIQYLSGAQGSGAGSAGFLSLVGRDISSLKHDLVGATADQKTKLLAGISILSGIIKDKKFIADTPKINIIPTTLKGKAADDLAMNSDKAKQIAADTRENNRIARQTGTKIDYAKIATTRATDDVTSAVDRMNTDLQRAIAALGGKFSVTITSAQIARKHAEVLGRDNVTTANRGGPGIG